MKNFLYILCLFSFCLSCKKDIIEDPIYSVVDKQAKYDGIIGNNIKYPSAAQRANISRTVSVRFIVEKDGTANFFEVLTGIGYGCDEESLRVLKALPNKWIPATINGKIVRSYYIMPFVFKIE